MSNRTIFVPNGPNVPVADTTNAAGGKAYKTSDRQNLAQIAATNCFNGTFYVKAEDNLKIAKAAVEALRGDPEFLAKVAVYSRSKSYMKDMPTFIVGMLATIDPKAFRKAFRRVIDNGKMLRNFCQMARSGAFGKKINLSSGTVRNAIQEWFDTANPRTIFNASIGQEFPFRDILGAVRPTPNTAEKAALLAYLKGTKLNSETNTYQVFRSRNGVRGENMYVAYEHPFSNLPTLVQDYEKFKKDTTGEVPKVDFRMLDSLGLTDAQWAEIAKTAPWQMTRMNLNTFARHGVFKDDSIIKIVSDRLRNKDDIVKARVFPYTLMTAWKATEAGAPRSVYAKNEAAVVPPEVRNALQDAMEVACNNVPEFPGKIVICVDVSGSMKAPVTGESAASTTVNCLDVASMFAASILRKNPLAEIIVFSDKIHPTNLNPRDSIATNATKLSSIRGGGTACQMPLMKLNQENAKADAVLFISDYESWIEGGGYSYYGSRGSDRASAPMFLEWTKFLSRNQNAKLICMDLTPKNGNSQVVERSNVLQVGGFSDQVFDVVSSFLKHGHDKNHWVEVIDDVDLSGGNSL